MVLARVREVRPVPAVALFVHDVARKLLDAISQPIGVGALQLMVTASIGVALFPFHGIDAQTLVSVADGCMYEVKRTGRAGVRVASSVSIQA